MSFLIFFCVFRVRFRFSLFVLRFSLFVVRFVYLLVLIVLVFVFRLLFVFSRFIFVLFHGDFFDRDGPTAVAGRTSTDTLVTVMMDGGDVEGDACCGWRGNFWPNTFLIDEVHETNKIDTSPFSFLESQTGGAYTY